MGKSYEQIEYTVIGAGVVGLAIARALALQGKEVCILESEKTIGSGISSRNSEVIHAGLYYPKNSLKARFCVRGKNLLYDYVNERKIEHKQCGKLIVATSEGQIEKLHEIKTKAIANNVNDLSFLSQAEMQTLEPDINGVAALISPSTGIIDTHALMTSFMGDIENAGGFCSFLSTVEKIEKSNDEFLIHINSQNETIRIKTKNVINAAGLNAVPLAHNIKDFPADKIPELKYAKGNYFSLSGKHNFKHLIYPVPEAAGLGIHLTLDLQGKARFGPDVEWVNKPDFQINKDRAEHFYSAIRKYWPNLTDGKLSPDYAGLRPKIFIKGQAYTDFLIQDKNDHGINGLINLFGIESPGLTASMAIAERIKNQLIN